MSGPVLAERDPELSELDSALELAADGVGRTVVIDGSAGIGKTALLATARTRAASSGFTCLWARGSELETGFGFGVVRQLFEAVVHDPSVGEDVLSGAASPAAAVFGGATEAPAGEDGSFSTMHGLYWLSLNLAGDRPLGLLVDDLQWVDVPSLRFFAYLARRLEGLEIALCTSLRSTEPGSDPGLIGEIVADPATLSLHPGPLGPGTVGQMVADRLGPELDRGFIDATARMTGGNPLLLEQLLGALASEGVRPEGGGIGAITEIGARGVGRLVIRKLARLPEGASTLARALAVLGNGAEIELLGRLADLDLDTVAELSEQLGREEILGRGGELRFAHPLIRESVYRALPAVQRQLLHARAAELLREVEAPARPSGSRVEGISWSRSVLSAPSERWSTPFPASGTVSRATSPAGDSSLRAGPNWPSELIASCNSRTAAAPSPLRRSPPETTTVAGVAPPGNAALM